MGWLRRLGRRQDPAPVAEYGRVAPWLLVGPALSDEGYAELARAGVTHVLDLRSEASDDPELMRSLGLAWRRVPIDDRFAPTADQLREIRDWLESERSARAATGGGADGADADEPVLYAHCQGGMGRAPTVAIALLMSRGFTRAEAHRFVVTARSVAAPTPEQDAWLATIEVERA